MTVIKNSVIQFTIMICILICCQPSLAHDNSRDGALVDLVKDFFTAHENGDVERLAQLSSEDIVWEAQSSLPTGGKFIGIDEVIANVFNKTAFYLSGFKIEPVEVYQSENVVFALTRVRVDGIEDSRGLQIFYFENQKVIRYVSFLDTIAMMSAATRLPD